MKVVARNPSAEFRSLVAAEISSVLGDQFSKVTLTIAVFDRTGSAVLSGLAYGITFFPPLLTGATLGWIADRFPRRSVMVACCVLQAAVLFCAAAWGAPTVLIVVASAVVGAVQPVFKAAQLTIVNDILGDDGGARARPLLFVLREAGLLVGLSLGGFAVVAVGAVPALLVDATSFVVAAVLLRSGLRHRALPDDGEAPPADPDRRPRPVRLRGRPGVAAMLVVPAAIGLAAAPTAVIAPLAGELAVPPWAIGLLLAADSVGVLLAGVVLTRTSAERQAHLLYPLAAMTLLPLFLLPLTPPPAVVFVLFALTGAGSMALAPAQTRLLDRLPNHARGRAVALSSSILRASQGGGAVLAGPLTAALDDAALAVAAVAALAGIALVVAGALGAQGGVSRR